MPSPHADETKARPELVGAQVHAVIAHLAAHTTTPEVAAIRHAVARSFPHLGRNEGRAHKQNIAAQVRTYFTQLLPPTDYRFAGSEVHLGQGRIDLLWRHADDTMLIDEIKTGYGFLLANTRTLTQAHRYLTEGLTVYGRALAGLRLVSTYEPRASLFLSPGNPARELFTTPFTRPRSTR